MSSGLAIRNLVAGLVFSCSGVLALAAEIYDIDPRHTFSAFEYDHWGLSHQQGRFDSTQGLIQFSPETGTGEITIEIDAASVNTGIASFDQLLRSADFFDVENHPRIIFKSSVLRFEGKRLSEVEGTLTIKGIEHPVLLKVDRYHCRFMLIYGARACGANASAAILRSDFDLGRYTPFVSDQVDLQIRIEAIRRNPGAEP